VREKEHFCVGVDLWAGWPTSVFSLDSLAYVAAVREGEEVPIGLATLNEHSQALPVLAVRSRGAIRYLGRSDLKFTTSGTTWSPLTRKGRNATAWNPPDDNVFPVGRFMLGGYGFAWNRFSDSQEPSRSFLLSTAAVNGTVSTGHGAWTITLCAVVQGRCVAAAR
jgi:hypothetical protein